MVYEMIIIIILILIIAAIAIPGLMRARISANEASSIGTLRTLATSQEQFKHGVGVDQDDDGTGEYGLLNELSGVTNCRDSKGGYSKAPLFPSYITRRLACKHRGFASKSGYSFKVYLPGIVTDTGRGPVKGTKNAETIDAQENSWIAYAWPMQFRSSGIRAFAVDQAGEVFASPNFRNPYTATKYPTYNAALSKKATKTSFGSIVVKIEILAMEDTGFLLNKFIDM